MFPVLLMAFNFHKSVRGSMNRKYLYSRKSSVSSDWLIYNVTLELVHVKSCYRIPIKDTVGLVIKLCRSLATSFTRGTHVGPRKGSHQMGLYAHH